MIYPNIDIAFGILGKLHVDEYMSVERLSSQLNFSTVTIKLNGKFLVLSGVLETKKGTGGGYRLRKPLSEIYLRELFPLFRGEKEVVKTIFKLSSHLTVKKFLTLS